MLEQVGIGFKHATIKNAQTTGMMKKTHQELKTILKINFRTYQIQWEQYLNIAVMAHNTTYQASLMCGLMEIFHGRTPQNARDLKFANPMHLANPPRDIWKMLDEVNEKYKGNLHKVVGSHLERNSY